ncbi:hypothetical protein [[Phormidium] sp. ETS-05]|uniref:hypothetical protein n=1 Tax=[Phormidium] sp. ETS-05 TaxID=222819 RepID=UPI0018EEF9C3|nr:hypothetical protein [[Phormidium] sp. ETS-05]
MAIDNYSTLSNAKAQTPLPTAGVGTLVRASAAIDGQTAVSITHQPRFSHLNHT